MLALSLEGFRPRLDLLAPPAQLDLQRPNFHCLRLSPLAATLTRIRPFFKNMPPLSPFLATLTDTTQLHENITTLSPVFATLTRLITHNPFVCHSCEKHPGSHLSSQRSFRSGFSRPNFLPTPHSPLATKLLRIRTYEKRACNSRRICTCKTQDLKPFRIRTYEKNRGEGSSLLTRNPFHRTAYSSSTIPASFRGLHER